MARASSRTLLPLDTFAKIMGMHPLHFNGVQVDTIAPATTCGSPIMQYAWQATDAISREDIAIAIADAEARIAQYTRFKLLPTFEADERHPWPRGATPEAFGGWSYGARGQGAAVKTNYGHLVSGGIEGVLALALNAPVVYTDTDGDGFSETATIAVSLPTSVTDPNEIAVFYPGESADREWEIRPLVVSVSGGVATIRARREQFVNPGFLESYGVRSVDGLDPASFLATVDVYRMYHDPSQQVQFLWEGPSAGMCGCSQGGCQTCFLSAQFGCTLVRDYRTGLISASPAVWNSATYGYEGAGLAIGRAPDRVRLWYRAGYRDATTRRPMVEMDPRWQRAVAYYAASMLARPMCQCENVSALVSHLQVDLSKSVASQGAGENYRTSNEMLDNPFGTTRGAVEAWKVFRREAIGEAVLL